MAASPKPNPKSERVVEFNHDEVIRIWEKSVDTQMHFNEMSVKSRQLGLTFVAAALGVGILLLSDSKDYYIHIPLRILILHVHVTSLVTFGALLGVLAVRSLDINVYHKMLRGAVTFGEDLEKNVIAPKLKLQFGMTQSISHFSRYEDAKVDKSGNRYLYTGEKQKNALQKISNFYFWVIVSLSVISISTLIAMHFSFSEENQRGILLKFSDHIQKLMW